MNDQSLLNETSMVDRLQEGSNGLLTRKEAEISNFLVEDYTVNEIAELLSRSKNTIKMHIKNIKRKCKCGTRTRLGAILQSFIKNNPGGYINIDDNG